MSNQPWTIDTIAHALPHPDQRAAFMRDVSFTSVDQLPARLERWQRFVEQIQAAGTRAEQLREYAEQHDGQLPSDYRETPESRDAWNEWEQQMRQHQGHNAA
ncbi:MULTISPECIES: hypothetical protein [unclassified Streptomyces]|uniref:hypothetical protein n=1 Tax=unclassified Streptomyces TaxID=2593676 RepID=UPI002DDA3408|nr:MULTISPECIES: hypothetical protein [unclassified Streptomyces]WSS46849.1 hypothetical protein OG220_40550 [Streptomyces sp. NBC_01187]WSA97634.1 hypothetical protein OIE63_39670 [Streptomyces sp. NBC_01795]WSB82116.1 hypothetical protein OHB04_41145 [Streptomyces sp. NBC_01775]WSS18087.1 hypothetical protein OG533_40225 [Streptomyces sp. NBC_01186]WSS46934.1 hypothetical protein OG220_41075 [Streptomyces sp. NBC_01187]